MKNKKILLLILPVFAMMFFGCGLFQKEDVGSVKDPSQLEQGEKTTLTGRVSFYMDGDYFFTLEDADQMYTIFISGSQVMVTGDYVEVSGVWEKEANGLEAENIKKLSENEKMTYFKSRSPFLEITVLEYPTVVEHTCDIPVFKLRVKNAGKEVVTHEELHSYDYDYGFYYFINESWNRANADRENYAQVQNEVAEDEKGLIGLLSNQGFLNFGDIQPGETKEIEYWGGGQVTKTEGGTAGSPNIFGNQPVGEFEVSFAWANKNNYDPIFLFKTEPFKVRLASDKCDLGL